MTKAIIGKKIGMTQIFDEAGKVVPVTVIEAGPCVVVQKKTTENDGYEAVPLGFGDTTPKHVNKPMAGHFKKNDVAFKRTLKEFRFDDISGMNVGDVLKADTNSATKLAAIADFDRVLCLNLIANAEKLAKPAEEELPEEIKALAEERKQARKDKNFALADELRDKIVALGYTVEETRQGTVIKKA